MYRLVMDYNKGLRIGLKQYTKEDVDKRVKELALIGIKMRVMSEKDLFS